MPSDVYYQTRTPVLYGGTISLQVLSTLIVALRFLARRVSKAGLWWDDWLIVPALLFDWGISACSWYQARHAGFGRHTEAAGGPVTHQQVVLFFKGLMALQIFYFLTAALFKTSLILLYYRIFGVSKGFRRALLVAWILVLFYFVANLLAAIFECNPIAMYWDKSIPGGKCVNEVAFYRWNGVANLLIDFMILTLPIPMIWRLSLKLQQKISLTGLFLLGAFVVVASIVRVTTFAEVVATDITYTLVISSIWSTVEQSIGIICACLPILPALFRRLLGLSTQNARSGESYPRSGPSIKLAQLAKAKQSNTTTTDTDTGTRSGFFRLDEERLEGEHLGMEPKSVETNVTAATMLGGKDHRRGMPGGIVRNQSIEQHSDIEQV